LRADFALVEDGDSDVQFAEVVGDGAAYDAAPDDEDVGSVSHGLVVSKNSYRRLYHSAELGLLGPGTFVSVGIDLSSRPCLEVYL